MSLNVNLEPVYQHHDLLIEIGRIELAMDHLSDQDVPERETIRPRLERRMNTLLQQLDRLVA